jgi:DNA-directed RNA polymerase subunit K/omega
MSYVPLEKLIDKSNGSMYKLCVFVSRRALELAEGAARLVEAPADIKVTTLAMMEVAAGKVQMKPDTKQGANVA